MSEWFLVQTKPKQEVRALENLERQGLKAFCPQILVEKIRRGQRKVSKEVLFPNYLLLILTKHWYPPHRLTTLGA